MLRSCSCSAGSISTRGVSGGDNTLEHAKYLGYLDAKELYPDLKPREFKDYVQAVVDGTAPKVWEASQDWGN